MDALSCIQALHDWISKQFKTSQICHASFPRHAIATPTAAKSKLRCIDHSKRTLAHWPGQRHLRCDKSSAHSCTCGRIHILYCLWMSPRAISISNKKFKSECQKFKQSYQLLDKGCPSAWHMHSQGCDCCNQPQESWGLRPCAGCERSNCSVV